MSSNISGGHGGSTAVGGGIGTTVCMPGSGCSNVGTSRSRGTSHSSSGPTSSTILPGHCSAVNSSCSFGCISMSSLPFGISPLTGSVPGPNTILTGTGIQLSPLPSCSSPAVLTTSLSSNSGTEANVSADKPSFCSLATSTTDHCHLLAIPASSSCGIGVAGIGTSPACSGSLGSGKVFERRTRAQFEKHHHHYPNSNSTINNNNQSHHQHQQIHQLGPGVGEMPARPCVPFIAIGLTNRLIHFELRHPDTVDSGRGTMLVNFWKHRRLTEMVERYLAFQRLPYDFALDSKVRVR
ncbi:unnamed protein product [Protopolystoma xenopodis]|uniref:Uncharacterized protein n=1 Tax=Protopolystoma xenopodis TaxID=117903 RepID=A0A3S4ZRX3_9PLAT|nr:unnamed protein product [Protopolystoma xenopodis]